MVRECARWLAIAAMSLTTGACSLLLDFSEGAAPHDAAIDAPYTQEQCDYKEPNDALASPSILSAGDAGPAAICAATGGAPEDHDFYRFTAAATTATIALQFMNRAGGDLDLKLYDSTGTMISQSRGFGDGEMIVCPGTAPTCPMIVAGGDYVFEVFPAIPGSVNSYTFSVQ